MYVDMPIYCSGRLLLETRFLGQLQKMQVSPATVALKTRAGVFRPEWGAPRPHRSWNRAAPLTRVGRGRQVHAALFTSSSPVQKRPFQIKPSGKPLSKLITRRAVETVHRDQVLLSWSWLHSLRPPGSPGIRALGGDNTGSGLGSGLSRVERCGQSELVNIPALWLWLQR